MLKAIHAQEDAQAAREKATQIAAKLKGMKLGRAAEIVAAGVEETLSYYSFPPEHWRLLRTNNPMEAIDAGDPTTNAGRGRFPDGKSALMLVAARLRYIAGTK